jgi:uncharacterized membrane protein YdjX (TVP38/TMEM64 family)
VRKHARIGLLIVLLLALALVWFSPLRAHLNRDEIRGAVESVRGTWYAPLVLIAMYAVGCVLAIPASLFIIAAGAIWGWLLGGTLAMFGGMLGAMASFYTGRFFGSGEGHPRLRDAGFRSLLILRLLPIFPFAVLNYGAGIARVNSAAFFLSTFLGLIPSNFVFAWSADEIFNGSLDGRGVMMRLLTVAALCIVAVAIPSLLAHTMRRRAARG